MDAPQTDAMIDSTMYFWDLLRCLFLFPSVDTGAANLKLPMVFPHYFD